MTKRLIAGVVLLAALSPAAARAQGWAEATGLFWRMKEAPLPIPLLTTGDPAADPLSGAVGRPGTALVYGPSSFDYGTASGYRVAIGGWLPGEPAGGEIRFFSLRTQQAQVAFGSTDIGGPPLFFPFQDALTGAEDRLLISNPGVNQAGAVNVLSETRFNGWEANGYLIATRDGDVEADLLAGIRVANLVEQLAILNTFRAPRFGAATNFQDQFETDNRFFGGQVGARGTFWFGPAFVGGAVKLAVGTTRSVVDVRGATLQGAPPPAVSGLVSGAFPGGFYTQPTNIGRRTELNWTMLPELDLRAGLRVAPGVQVFVGYNLLYWSRVARPGDQIDRAINRTQNPTTTGLGTGVLTGEPRPLPQFNTADFWAQGLTLGLEVRF